MSLFDDDLLHDFEAERDRRLEPLARRLEQALEDLELRAYVSYDAVSGRLSINTHLGAYPSAEHFVCMIEDLGR